MASHGALLAGLLAVCVCVCVCVSGACGARRRGAPCTHAPVGAVLQRRCRAAAPTLSALARLTRHTARHFHPNMGRLTPRVVTLWYRAPELLLGGDTYGPAIDCWCACGVCRVCCHVLWCPAEAQRACCG
jgi:serine/threonine protein kinase